MEGRIGDYFRILGIKRLSVQEISDNFWCMNTILTKKELMYHFTNLEKAINEAIKWIENSNKV